MTVASLCGTLALSGSVQAEGQSLTLRTVQQSNALLKYSRQHAGKPGLCLEILRAVESVDPGIRFEGLQRDAPLRRVESMLRAGEIDVFFCLLKSVERELEWDYLPVPLYTVRHIVVQRKADAKQAIAFSDLIALSRAAPIAVTRGTTVARSLKAQGFSVQEVGGDHEALMMLLKGRTQVVYGQDANLLHLIGEMGLRDVVQVSTSAYGVQDQYVVVSRAVPQSVKDRLTVALETLRRNGVFVGLANKYMDGDASMGHSR